MKNKSLNKVNEVRQMIANRQYEEASVIIDKRLKLEPHIHDWRILRCALFIDTNSLSSAFEWLQALLLKRSTKANLELYYDLLRAAFAREDFNLLDDSASWLIQVFPENAWSWNFKGIANLAKGEFKAGLEFLQKAIELDRNNPNILVNLINALNTNGQPDLALPYVEQGVRLAPEMPMMLNNAGNTYRMLGEVKRAIELYQKVLTFEPDNGEVQANLGAAYLNLEEYDLARDCFNRALVLRPDLSLVKSSLAYILIHEGKVREAIELCETALQEYPETPNVWAAYGYLLAKANYLNAAIDALVKAIALFKRATSTELLHEVYSQLLFCMISHPDLPLQDIVAVLREFNERFCLNLLKEKPRYLNQLDVNKRIRLGFVGHSFMHHSCSRFVRPLIAHLDRQQVEVYIYATQGKEDDFTRWYKATADQFFSASGSSNRQLLEKIRSDQIDVLVELDGHCFGNRLLMMAQKPAPVSLHWLDFGTTTGVTAIDYYLSDRFTTPVELQPIISEKIWHLAGHSTVFEPPHNIGEINELPYLKNGYITFGSLTRSIRVNHRVVRIWSAVLQAMPDARLVLNSNDLADAKVREEMASRFVEQGIERERLLFGYDTPPWDVLRGIDIGLDCFPQNSGTTLMEMLYMGIPFVTLADRPPVGRIGTGILCNLGHPEWIAETEQEYAEKLVCLAHDIEGLVALRKRLRSEMENSVIMDAPFFARSFEQAVRGMWQRYCEEQSQ